jgi:uncharacterized protein YbjT (DUF2867 family)
MNCEASDWEGFGLATVLVAGGTGFIGSHIVKELVASGHTVSVMTRNPKRTAGRLPSSVKLVAGNVQDPASMQRAMTGIDVVINAVQFPNHPVEKPSKGYTYMKVDGEGTARLVSAAKDAGVKRFIYLSGAGVRPGQTKPWFVAKLFAEQAIRTSGVPFTIFRPSWVYGKEDRTLNKFVTFAKLLPFIPVVGNGQTKVQPVSILDLAKVVAASVTLPRTINQTYDVGGPEELTMDAIVQTMLKAMGKRRPLIHQPAALMKLLTIPLQLLPAPPLSPSAVDFVLMEEHVDNRNLRRDFGIKLTPLAEGLSYLRP